MQVLPKSFVHRPRRQGFALGFCAATEQSSMEMRPSLSLEKPRPSKGWKWPMRPAKPIRRGGNNSGGRPCIFSRRKGAFPPSIMSRTFLPDGVVCSTRTPSRECTSRGWATTPLFLTGPDHNRIFGFRVLLLRHMVADWTMARRVLRVSRRIVLVQKRNSSPLAVEFWDAPGHHGLLSSSEPSPDFIAGPATFLVQNCTRPANVLKSKGVTTMGRLTDKNIPYHTGR